MFAAASFPSHIPKRIKGNWWKFENASALATLFVFGYVFIGFTAVVHHNLDQSWRHKSFWSDLQAWELDGLFFDDRISLLCQTAFGAGTYNITVFSSECTFRMAIGEPRGCTKFNLIGEQTATSIAF